MSFRVPGEARIRSFPAGWTDVEPPDTFRALAAGRAFFRVEDLLALAALIEELGGGRK